MLAAFTTFALVGLVLIALSLGLVFVAQETPARTPKGAALLGGLGELQSVLLIRWSLVRVQPPQPISYEVTARLNTMRITPEALPELVDVLAASVSVVMVEPVA